MKQFKGCKSLRLFLALALVLALAVPAWSASLTLTTETHHVIGNLRLVTGTAAVNSGDTLAVPLGTVLFVGYSLRAASQGGSVPDFSHTISGTTVTFQTNTDGNTWEFFIVGF